MSTLAKAATGLAVGCLVVSMPATAQRNRPHFGVGASLAAPTGDFRADPNGDGFKIGWRGGAFIDFESRKSPLGLRVEGSYGENAGNDHFNAELTAELGQPTTAKTKMLGGSADVIFNLKSSSRRGGYLLGGIGSYRVTLAATAGSVTADTSETKVAWNVGAGFSGNPRGSGLLLELRYFSVAGLGELPRINFFALTAGVRFGGN